MLTGGELSVMMYRRGDGGAASGLAQTTLNNTASTSVFVRISTLFGALRQVLAAARGQHTSNAKAAATCGELHFSIGNSSRVCHTASYM